MKPLAILLIVCTALLVTGCGSTPTKSTKAAATAQPECICGTHEARIHGCHAPACVSGQGNPDNKQCFCAPLKPAGAPAKGG